MGHEIFVLRQLKSTRGGSVSIREMERKILPIANIFAGPNIPSRIVRVTKQILAMARPNTSTFGEHKLLEQFERSARLIPFTIGASLQPRLCMCVDNCRCGIQTVFNLQCVNEHAFCGAYPLDAGSGFSYDPELLMRNKSTVMQAISLPAARYFSESCFWCLF